MTLSNHLNPLPAAQSLRQSGQDKMKAMVQQEYGPAEVLALAEVDRPIPKDNQVLVRIQAASVHAGDWHLMRGTPFLSRLMFGGVLKPKVKIPGTDMAGCVEAIGSAVVQFQPGDEVFGDLSAVGFGAFAEYVAVPETALAPKPSNLSFEQAATVPVSALAALQGLRDVGQLQAGQRVLIQGASGGVGSFAVQIAKAWGAEVTAVCNGQKVDMVRSLHPDHIIDYDQQDPTQTGQQYDLIFDAAAYRSPADSLPALTPTGTYLVMGGSTARIFQAMLLGWWFTRGSERRVKCLVSTPNQADLLILKTLVETGQVTPAIYRSYSLSEVPKAIRHLEAREVQGKVAIRICDG